MITASIQQEIVDICRSHGIWLLSDEVYRFLGPTPDVHIPPAASLYERAISLGVMSKAYGLAGLRIGWIACQDEALIERIEQVKHYTTICNSAPSEVLALMALRQQDRLLARNNALVKENLPLADACISRHPQHLRWVKPQAGCTGFVHYTGNADAFAETLVKETGVFILPGSVYGEQSREYFRIGFGRRDFPEALEHFERFLVQYQKKAA